jgi:hypothetical protein
MFTSRLCSWIDGSTEKDIIAKFKNTDARKNLDILISALHNLATTHTTFLKDLKARLVTHIYSFA